MKIAKSLVTIVKSHKILSIFFGLTILSSIIVPAILFTLILPVYDEPIEILSDEDFLKYDYILGNGTFEDPYLIESRKIIDDTSVYGVHVENTTSFFVIRNCKINVDMYGIYLKNNAPNTAIIVDNAITVESYGGIYLAYTSGVSIRKNVVKNCYWGLLVIKSDNIDMDENVFESTSIEVSSSENCSFINNYAHDYSSVSFSSLTNITVDNNRFYGGTGAIGLGYLNNLTFTNNEIEFIGITISLMDYADLNNFEIKNNTVAGFPFGFFINQNNLTIEERYGQLFFYNCSHLSIRDQFFSSITETIRIYSCESITFQNISIISGEIYGYKSPLTSFNNVTIEGGRLRLLSCSNSSVEFSYVSNYRSACVEFISCPDSKFENNVVVNSSNEYAYMPRCCVTHGTYFSNSYNSTVVNNRFINSGLVTSFYELQTLQIHNNSVDGFPLGVFVNETNLMLSEKYGQLYLISCENVTIENQEMTAPVTAISALECNNLLIRKSSFKRYTPAIGRLNIGISIYTCNNITISECDFQYRAVAVAVRYSNNISLLSNSAVNGDQCFDIRESDYCLIQENEIVDGHNVIEIHNTNNIIITNNILNNCEWNGIKIVDCLENLTISFNVIKCIEEECDHAIFFDNVVGSMVYRNQISSATYGILLRDSSMNIIFNNTIQSCTSYAIKIESGSHYNEVYYNNFIQNNLGGNSQGYDANIDNIWYNISEQIGNYWDDLDEPIYAIDGPTEQKDENPINIPFS
ncbi:MAG: right-handed parallel beta-helix repeat-containing protein [Candidatus Heimdallarchaeaceae archaeon]